MGRNHDSCAQGLCQVQRVARPCARSCARCGPGAQCRTRPGRTSGSASSMVWPPPTRAPASRTASAPPCGSAAATAVPNSSSSASRLRSARGFAPHRKPSDNDVGRSYAELVRVVHDGREEVDGEDCRRVVAQPVDRRRRRSSRTRAAGAPLEQGVSCGVRGDHEGVAQRPAAGGRRSLRVSAGGEDSTGVPVGSGSRCAQSASTGGRSRRA